MKTYEVILTRSYVVEIDARNEEDATYLAEFYVGGEKDLSNDRERSIQGFRINEIEMTVNEAIGSCEMTNA